MGSERDVIGRNGDVTTVPAGMMFPVRCHHCGDVYDIAAVEVTARYADATVWTTPCCGVPGVDDRPWVARRHYTPMPGNPLADERATL